MILAVFIVIVLCFPLLLLAMLLGMERVEKPLRDAAVPTDVDRFLATASPDELETLVSEGYSQALNRYWRRRRLVRRAQLGRRHRSVS